MLGWEQKNNIEFSEHCNNNNKKKLKSTANSLSIDIIYVHSTHKDRKFSRAGIKDIKYSIHTDLPSLLTVNLVDAVKKNLILSYNLLSLRY